MTSPGGMPTSAGFSSLMTEPIFQGNIFLNFSDSVCFEGLETLTSTIDPIGNNGTASEGIKIAGWMM